MKFLVDEGTGISVAKLLRELGYDVCSVTEEMQGSTDQVVLSRAVREERVMVTNDKELASLALSFRPVGILLLRLADERTEVKLKVVRKVLTEHLDKMEGNLIVATEKKVRIRPF